MKIGFYDSGLGGIKTLKDIIDMGLKEEIYFLADEKNKPYGIKTKEEIEEIVIKNIQKLVDFGCEIIVVACNTATSVAIDILREQFKNIEIIGTEPAVKVALDEDTEKKKILMATTLTLKGKKIANLIEKLQAKDKVVLLPADELVTLVEDINFNKNKSLVEKYLGNLYKQYNLNEYSHVILGCTHFSIAKTNIENFLRQYNIKVIDGNEGIGKNLFNKIKERKQDILDKKDSDVIHIINTKESESFNIRAKEILKLDKI